MVSPKSNLHDCVVTIQFCWIQFLCWQLLYMAYNLSVFRLMVWHVIVILRIIMRYYNRMCSELMPIIFMMSLWCHKNMSRHGKNIQLRSHMPSHPFFTVSHPFCWDTRYVNLCMFSYPEIIIHIWKWTMICCKINFIKNIPGNAKQKKYV